MPTVPTLDNFRVSPQGGGFTPVQSGFDVQRANAEQTQRTGEALGNAGATLGRVATEMQGRANKAMQDAQDQADQVRVQDAVNQARIRMQTLTYDPQVGYQAQKGLNALKRESGKALPEEYGEKLQSAFTELTDGLDNDRQKALFRNTAGQLGVQFQGSAQSHMLSEFTGYKASVQDASIDLAGQDALRDWSDPAKVAAAAATVKAATVEKFRVLGMQGAPTDAALLATMSKLHSDVAFTAIDAGNAAYARGYVANLGDGEVTAQAREKIGKALEVAESKERVQVFADEVMGKNLSRLDAVAEARKKFAGKDEDEAVREVHQRFNEIDVAGAQAVKDLTRGAWSAVMGTGRLPPTLVAELRSKAPEEERQIREYLDAKMRRAKADAEGKQTDGFDTYYGLVRMATDEPAKFAELDLRKVAPLLGKSQLNSLVGMQSGINKGEAKAMETGRVVKQTLATIRSEVLAVGIDLSPKEGTPAAKETAKFMGALTMALDDATREKGKPLTPDEANRIGMSMVREGVEQGSGVFGFFQNKKLGYQIATDPNIAPGSSFVTRAYADIPPTARDALLGELFPKGSPKGMYGAQTVSAEDKRKIERAYQRGVDAGRFR